MVYDKQTWQNSPSTSTPITAERLTHLETQYDNSVAYTDQKNLSKADLVGGKVPMGQVNTSESATPGTIPVRTTSGRIPGVGNPQEAGDAVNQGSMASALAPVVSTSPGTGVRFVGGTLRRVSSTSWEVLNDAGHAPVGIASVSIVGGDRLRVTYNFTASKVVTFSVTPDDAFAGIANVLKMGPSVGLSYTDIYLYLGATTTTPVDPGALSTPGANLWISGIFLT